MNVLVLDSFFDNKMIYHSLKNKVIKSLIHLRNNRECLNVFLKNKNGKKIFDVFKYKLDDGYRVLYTYSKYFKNLNEDPKYSNSLVILKISEHDKQSFTAKNTKFDWATKTYTLGEAINILDPTINCSIELSDEEIEVIEQLVDYNDSIEVNIKDHVKKYSELTRLTGKRIFEDKFLSESQGRIIKDFLEDLPIKPMVLYGGAGTGKTFVSLFILKEFVKSTSKKALYVTHSLALREQIKSQLNSLMNGDNEFIDYFDISDYCIKKLNIETDRYCDLNRMIKFFDILLNQNHSFHSYCLNSNDLITEIRGQIKGSELHELSLEEYLAVVKAGGSDILNANEIQRAECVYKGYLKYKEYLGKEKLFDDNDLARILLSKNYKDSFELIVVDEVQDYSRLQLLLMINIASNKNSMFFTGDIHQNVNPTCYKLETLKNIFSGFGINIKERVLLENFRNPPQITHISNALLDLRRNKVVATKSELEQHEISICNDNSIITRMTNSSKNVEDLLMDIFDNLYTEINIVVPSIVEKEFLFNVLMNKRPSIEKGIFNSIVKTLPEIKGTEFNYVICYQIIGKNYDEWDALFNNTQKNIKNIFLFNSIYVAISRSFKNILFIDSDYVNQLEDIIRPKFLNYYDSKTLEIANLPKGEESSFNYAIKLYKNGQYEDAIEWFNKCKNKDTSSYIINCHLKLCEINKDSFGSLYWNLALGNNIGDFYSLKTSEPKFNTVMSLIKDAKFYSAYLFFKQSKIDNNYLNLVLRKILNMSKNSVKNRLK